jgi:hypothetical protein
LISYILVIVAGLGLFGVLLALVISSVIYVAFYTHATFDEVREKAELRYVKRWTKLSTTYLYQFVGDKLGIVGDVLLLAYVGAIARAYMGASNIVARTIVYSVALSAALYPKMLSGYSEEDVRTSFRIVFMMAIPMTFGVFFLSDSFLAIINPAFRYAAPLLQLMAIGCLLECFRAIIIPTLLATERSDLERELPLSKLVRSMFFIVPSFTYLRCAIYLPAVYLILTRVGGTPLEVTIYVYLAGLATFLIILLMEYILVRRRVPVFPIPIESFGKFLLSALLMIAALFCLSPLVAPFRPSIRLVSLVSFGALTYFVTLLCIDKETRNLVKLILAELRQVITTRFLSHK